ncbi:MAG: outer membrane protein assembly factor BamD [Deltaproteobacteria bacterium]|jgi:outer membrane protein assembly factor BamD|nr:outer membrane protein assembly factor BamD [Deltaproteobacteria bacterium]
MRDIHFVRRGLLVFSCLFFLGGCGIIDYFFLPVPEDTAQELFESANEYMRDKDYANAIERYKKLKDNYPFSPYTIEAELSLADAYFLDSEFHLAAEAYKEYESMHPRNPAIPYVLYQIGQSHLKAFISIDRPTTDSREAHEYYQRLIETYPDSEYVESAKEAILLCRRNMAEHELYIGDMFWRTGRYGPAWKRYAYIVENFKDVEDVYSHAEQKAPAAYLRYREAQSKEVREQREGSWKKWFRWL